MFFYLHNGFSAGGNSRCVPGSPKYPCGLYNPFSSKLRSSTATCTNALVFRPLAVDVQPTHSSSVHHWQLTYLQRTCLLSKSYGTFNALVVCPTVACLLSKSSRTFNALVFCPPVDVPPTLSSSVQQQLTYLQRTRLLSTTYLQRTCLVSSTGS